LTVGMRPWGPHRAMISLWWVCDVKITRTYGADPACRSVIANLGAGSVDTTVAVVPWHRNRAVPPMAATG